MKFVAWQVFAETGSTHMEDGQAIPNMDDAYNKTVADIYTMYALSAARLILQWCPSDGMTTVCPGTR